MLKINLQVDNMKIVATFVENLFTFWYEGNPKDEFALQFSNWKDIIKISINLSGDTFQ